MQGLRPLQDENSMAHLHRGLLGKAAGLGGGEGGAGPLKKGTPSARKALGNITNRGGFGTENAPALPVGKTPGGGGTALAPRRALGDITNGPQTGGVKAAKPAEKAIAAPSAQAAAPVPTAAAAVAGPDSRAEALAEDGVEQLAGKGWEAQEADRAAAADAAILARLGALAAYGQHPAPPSFFPLWNAALASAAQPASLQKEALPSPLASPRAAPGTGGQAPSMDDLSSGLDICAPLELPALGVEDMEADLVLFDDEWEGV